MMVVEKELVERGKSGWRQPSDFENNAGESETNKAERLGLLHESSSHSE